MKKLIGLALILAPTTAHAADSFNLTCKGETRSSARLIPDEIKPYESVYRIDLTTRQWCVEDCKAPRPIADMSQVLFILDDIKPDTASSFRIRRQINRETGEEWTIIKMGGPGDITLESKGVCSRAPFTGFPKVKTAF